MKQLIHDIWVGGDRASAVLLFAILSVAGWLIALPLCAPVQDAYLERFHLQTPHFPTWAAQQLTPAMYNLENTYWYSEIPLSTADRLDASRRYRDRLEAPTNPPTAQSGTPAIQQDMLNHFPTRTMTFVQARGYLKQHPAGYFYFRSRYRGRQLESEFQIDPVDEHQSQVIRVRSHIE